MDLKIKKAFILAGGKGERLKPLTDRIPKVLLEVAGKPILQWNIELLKQFGVRKVVLGVGHMAGQIQEFFGNGKSFGIGIEYSVEKDFLGTAGALKEAERFFGGEHKIIMMNGDEVKDIDFAAMNRVFEHQKAEGVLSLVPVPDVSQFGSVQLQGNRIAAFLEKTASPQNEKGLVNAGAYILSGSVLETIPSRQKVSIEKEVFPVLAEKGALFGVPTNGQWFPTDTLERLTRARKEWKTVFSGH